ncbi:MAG: hypothetical protein PWP24_521 [Clostridiales bacterium]|nr:hypothetical protein [Clostridiales bacterium]
MIRGAARVIHYTGFIGGATQIVVKEEIQGSQNDSLIQLIDEMIPMLQTGEGEYEVPLLQDVTYQNHMSKVAEEWEKIKSEIYKVRNGESTKLLYDYSENTYNDINLAAFSAQAYMESYVNRIKIILYLLYLVFFVLLGVLFYTLAKNARLSSKAKTLNQMAYYDPYTGIANKASCDKKIEEYTQHSYLGYLTVIVLDLNRLKATNDQYGHQAGDLLIRNLALLLSRVGSEYGFVGRFGGDEFIGIFEDCSEEKAKRFMEQLVTVIKEKNGEIEHSWEKISCAVGYAVGYRGEKDIKTLFQEADQRMYEVKRIMKEKEREDLNLTKNNDSHEKNNFVKNL